MRRDQHVGAGMNPQELWGTLKASNGKTRFVFARENADGLFQGAQKHADLLEQLTDQEVFEACFDNPEYSSFIIDLTTRLVEERQSDDDVDRRFNPLRGPIEHCLWTIANSKRDSDQFVFFCNRFGRAIEPFILGVDTNFSNVMLPISDFALKDKNNPGIHALRVVIAKAMVER